MRIAGMILLALGAACASGQRVRVLSYNIHHGEGTDGAFDYERLARVIRDLEPDLVALQEVDRKTKRSSGVDQAAELGRLTGMRAIYGKAMDFAGGEYGEAVLTRLPVVEVARHPLPHRPKSEPRVALAVRVRMKDKSELVFVGTHLDHQHDGEDRSLQTQRLVEIFKEHGDTPLLLAGDLNARPGSQEMLTLYDVWEPSDLHDLQPTFPSRMPHVKIDYVLHRPDDGWRVVSVEVVDDKVASDHCPLLVVLERP